MGPKWLRRRRIDSSEKEPEAQTRLDAKRDIGPLA